VSVRLITGVPGMPAMMQTNLKDSTYLVAGETLEDVLPLLKVLVAREHHGHSGATELATQLWYELGSGNMASWIRGVPTQDLVSLTAASGVSVLINMRGERWKNRGSALNDWLYNMQKGYGDAAPSPDRDQFHIELSKAAIVRLSELTSRPPALPAPPGA
jgi:hypothetical protein